MGPAAAEIAGERAAHIVFARLRLFREQRSGADDHAAGAVTALRHLLLNEGSLHRMRRPNRSKALQCHNRLALHVANRRQTGSRRAAVEENRAGAALAKTAAELTRGEPQSA